jgi:hypothetical protein
VASKVKSRTEWCRGCKKQADWLSVDDAALLYRVSSVALFRKAESGNLHCFETSEGLLLLCLDSLGRDADSPGLQIWQIEEDPHSCG